mmetsp:Transcript_1198/g.1698  ORF Transcript_1198/g.1698 Transcript_1198/m.1698 type:complete len:140 (-) Transcript_1198:261-680(-)|eukprot:CAMPEP_0196592746 /NCGR_PEP_ID=MMETSP1081-20130531/73671_1 /TAXON_ID=36882 /ORGANISM="Pyramimonas amylifera, Strain CCMP720" /LENGTH=139 /DNA_ID=CAMNT_0041916525 /DNA_START=278 /DNA_END=697 /DNA_ORIENTATION=-
MSGKRTYRGVPNGTSANGGAASGSSDEEEMQRTAPSPPTQRTSSRRQPRVDLSRLETSSLRKYRRVYKLGDSSGISKEDLIPAVARHWQNLVVEEEYETLLAFAMTLRKQSIAANAGASIEPNLQKVSKHKPGVKPKAK